MDALKVLSFISDIWLFSQAVSAFFPDVRVIVSNGECHLLCPILGLIIVTCQYIYDWLGHFTGFYNIFFLYYKTSDIVPKGMHLPWLCHSHSGMTAVLEGLSLTTTLQDHTKLLSSVRTAD